MYLVHTTWEDWRRKHPRTLVLSTRTGYRRDYDRDPYEGYAPRRDLPFDVAHFDPTDQPNAWVVGVEVAGVAKAYAFSGLEKIDGPVSDRANGRDLRVHYNREAQSASVTDRTGRPIPLVMACWFAWYAFHPDTRVFAAQ